MSRTIRVQSQREIQVAELTEEYYALQRPETGRSGPWVDEEKFETRKAAIEKADQIAKEHLERNQGFHPRRIVYIKEVAEYREARKDRW
ncbi:MAG: hypothetical protein ACXACI_01920 [Candidatus Hodarchaeales archaeon]|jgi:hypothetical protein